MRIKTDVVIVGTGVAGMFSALKLPRDKKIVIITKEDMRSSDSFLAQGKAKTMDAKLARATKWVGAVFIILTLVLNII